jgi:two-component system NtrC family sensor kinase
VRAFTRSAKLASVGELATGLAHEINNPLAIISAEQTNISDLLDEIPDTQLRDQLLESVRRIKGQVGRCGTITGKMLQFGRNRDSSLEPTELAPRIDEIAGLLERQAAVRNVTIRTQLEARLPKVLLDPVELEQVLVNLINNSFQAMPDGGEIRVRGAVNDREVQLEVQDDGHGMPSEVRERAFEPFFTTKPVGQGTGLGLSVCYGIVGSWGGRLEMESQLGRGTIVRIRLRVANSLPGAIGYRSAS